MKRAHEKVSIFIFSIVAIIAVGGLVWVYHQDTASPTGFVIGTGNIPLSISGQVLNCGTGDGRLLFTREDGKRYRGSAEGGFYNARVRTFSDVNTLYGVSFASGQFVQVLEVPMPTSSSMQIDLNCATATPEPSVTPIPTDDPMPTEVPTPSVSPSPV